jgi:hypothetical protein
MREQEIRELVEKVRLGEEALAKLVALGSPPSKVDQNNAPKGSGLRGRIFHRSERGLDSIAERVLAQVKAAKGEPVHLDALHKAMPRTLRASICSACGELVEVGRIERVSLGWYRSK